MNKDDILVVFYGFSSAITGFSVFDLQGTGVGETYWETLKKHVKPNHLKELTAVWSGIHKESGENAALRNRLLRQRMFSNLTLGPLVRSLIKMWYSGSWYNPETGEASVICSQTYVEGLLWPAIGVNPKGAKQPGFGTWNQPPVTP